MSLNREKFVKEIWENLQQDSPIAQPSAVLRLLPSSPLSPIGHA